MGTVDPAAAVISVAADNPVRTPSDRSTDRLTALRGETHIFYTSDHGTVQFITDGQRLWVKTETP